MLFDRFFCYYGIVNLIFYGSTELYDQRANSTDIDVR